MRFEYLTTFVPVAYESEERGVYTGTGIGIGIGYSLTAGYYLFWKRLVE
jgi:hypothetical protein